MKIVKLAYYDEFHCIGPECTDSCCKNWGIFLSKREYLNYKKMDCSPELKSIIDTAFKRIRIDDYRYAEMKLKEHGDCPFLGEDCLCKIQKEKGEEALTFVCSIFPRKTCNVGGEASIFALDITCSHVVELLIKHPEGLALVEEEYKGDNPWIEKNLFSGKTVDRNWESYPYFWVIKNAQLDILQNRNFTIPERMLILGFFCQKANEYIKAKEGEKIKGLANMLLDNEMSRKIADSLKAPQSDESAAIKSVDILAKMWHGLHKDCGEYLRDLFDQTANSVEINVEETDDGKYTTTTYNREKYTKNVEIYRKIESDRPYIFENLLVNLIFTQDFRQGAWANFFELAVFYNTFKICIPAFLKENWTDRELALAITYAAKMVINTKLAQNSITASFTWNNSFDLPHAAFLIS